MKILVPLLLVFIVSCGGEVEEEVENLDQVENNEDIVEYDLDENRLNAVDFNNEMSNIMGSAVNSVDVLFSSDSSNIAINLDNAIFEMEMNLHKLEGIENIGNSEKFKVAVEDLLNFYLQEFNGDFNTIVPIVQKAEFTDEDDAVLDAYDIGFADEEKKLSDLINVEQEAFAAANNIKLTE